MKESRSQEHCRKISQSLKAYYATHDNPYKGRKRSEEFRRTVSEGVKRLWQDPTYREHRKNCRGWKIKDTSKMSIASKKLWENPEYREKQRKNNPGFKGHSHSKKVRQRIGEATKIRWADPMYRQKVRLSHLGPQEQHRAGVGKTIDALEAKGFRCIPLIRPLPDIIAIKGGMVFAVEYETGLKGADFEKYEKLNHPFDDVIWVVKDDLTKLEKLE